MESMGIPDEDSWFRRSYLPGGRAIGWRRVALLAMLVAAAIVLLLALLVAIS
jgi:hypothetical protein